MNDFFSNFREKATIIGIDECGFAPIKSQEDDFLKYTKWLSKNFHGNMKWIEENKSHRLNIQNLFPWASSYIIVALNYHNTFWQNSNAFSVSQYAFLNDYHYILKKKMKNLMEEMSLDYPDLKYDFFVDSKPVLEKSLAVKAGLGWIGKNTCLIIPQKGSFYFLGGIALNIENQNVNKETKNFCGNCTACIDACPTKALTEAYKLDARKCISYLTIEDKDSIDEDLHKKMSTSIIGCDICQNACPHNKKAIQISNSELINDDLLAFDQSKIHQIGSSEFKRIFKNTPFLRMGFKKLKRNIEIAQQINHD